MKTGRLVTLMVLAPTMALAGEWYDAKCGIPPMNKDRAAVLKFFAENVYGVRPDLSGFVPKSELVSSNDFGTCIRRQVKLNTMTPIGERTFVATAYFPKRPGKFPVWVMPGFDVPIRTFLEAHKPGKIDRWPVDLIVSNGQATVTFDYEDVLPDDPHVFDGITRPDDGWGAISTWALAASRVADWLGTVPEADASKLAVIGLSRLGKTALWAGATDERFALVCPNCSGLFGARCVTVNVVGETIERINRVFPHWFAPNCAKRWSNKDRELPFDQHWLLASVAPRLLAVGSATEDWWACPSGEFAGWFLARNVWKDQSRCDYHIRPGRHELLPSDWANDIAFAKRHGWGEKKEEAK